MKLKLWDRVLLALYAALGLVGSVCMGTVTVFALNGYQQFLQIAGFRVSLVNNPLSITVMILLTLLMLAWMLRLLHLAFRREPRVDKSSVSVQHTENGSVRVSVQAMDMLVKQAIGNTEGVADIKTSIVNHEDSITVKIDMTLESDVHIPNVTMLMQRSIKNFIEEFSGIAVREVTILVSKIIEVTPHPPLAINEPKPQPEIIDQTDEALPESEAEEPKSAEESAAETFEPPQVTEFEADHPQPEPPEEAGEEPAEQPAEAQPEPGADPDGGEEEPPVSERDFW